MNFIKKLWVKVRLAVIIILSIVIGAVWMYNYQSFRVMKCEAEATWNMVQQIQEQRKEIKSTEDDGGDVSSKLEEAPTQVSIVADTEDRIAVSIPTTQIEKIIYETFGEDEYQTARAVAFAESRLNAKATNTNTNGTTDCGVFQINSIHGLKDCTDPVKNIEYAKQLFDRSGWKPWVAWKTGAYKKFLASI